MNKLSYTIKSLKWQNILVPIVFFILGFTSFYVITQDVIRDMEKINQNTIELMKQFESMMAKRGTVVNHVIMSTQ